VRPTVYREINNFYTATVYEKGAEVVRMLTRLLGPENFRKGMNLYFAHHDGQAATIEQFVQCFADASGVDLTQFMLWYSQAGTPGGGSTGRLGGGGKALRPGPGPARARTPGQAEQGADGRPARQGTGRGRWARPAAQARRWARNRARRADSGQARRNLPVRRY